MQLFRCFKTNRPSSLVNKESKTFIVSLSLCSNSHSAYIRRYSPIDQIERMCLFVSSLLLYSPTALCNKFCPVPYHSKVCYYCYSVFVSVQLKLPWAGHVLTYKYVPAVSSNSTTTASVIRFANQQQGGLIHSVCVRNRLTVALTTHTFNYQLSNHCKLLFQVQSDLKINKSNLSFISCDLRNGFEIQKMLL